MNNKFPWKLAVVVIVTVASLYSMWPIDKKIKLGLDLKGGTSFLLQMDLSKIDATGRGQAIRQAVDIIRKRIDRFGVAEPVIQPAGENRILIQLPGLSEADKESAKEQIQKAAYLEFL